MELALGSESVDHGWHHRVLRLFKEKWCLHMLTKVFLICLVQLKI
jgi:hypothetical protein